MFKTKYHARHLLKNIKGKIISKFNNVVEIQHSSDAKKYGKYLLEKLNDFNEEDLKEYIYIININEDYCELCALYLSHNKYGKVLNINGTLHLEISSYETLRDQDLYIYINNMQCHVTEIKHEIKIFHESIKNPIILNEKISKIYEKLNNKNLILLSFILRSKLYKKIDIPFEKFLAAINITTNITESDIFLMFACEKLIDIITAKKYNKIISGASDVLDVKKFINKIIVLINEGRYVDDLIKIINNIETVTNISFRDTILCKRLTDDLIHKIRFVDVNTLKTQQKLKLIENYNLLDEDMLKKITRVKKILMTPMKGEINDSKISTKLTHLYLFNKPVFYNQIHVYIELIEAHVFKNFSVGFGEYLKSVFDSMIISLYN